MSQESRQTNPASGSASPFSTGSYDRDRLLTAAEVAELLGVKESWVREQTRAGTFPHVPLGRWRRYDPADVRAYVERVKKKP